MPFETLFRLDGRRVLITGNGLVAHAIARLFRAAGAEVVESEEPDLTEPGVATLFATTGAIDVLVNAAAVVGAFALDETTLERWDRIHAVNTRGTFLLMRAAVVAMCARGRGGRIINISTIGAVHPVLNGNYAYGSSRAGTNALTRQFALDFAKDGINTNAILVGPVFADVPAEGAMPPRGPAASMDRMPGGLGRPEDVAPTALLLAADGPGRFINGAMIVVDGGFLVG